MSASQSVKKCSKCGTMKPLAEFNRHKGQRDGLESQCRVCINAARNHPVSVSEKRCNKCREAKPASEFHRARSSRDGLFHRCKECAKGRRPKQYVTVERKTCADCREEKPTSAFYRNAAMSDGHHYYCKSCEAERHKKYRRIKVKQVARWRERNPHKLRALVHRWRIAPEEREGSFTGEEWVMLCEHYGNKCLACGEPGTPETLTVDHVTPLSKGGTNHILNIQPLCRSCNSRKNNNATDYRPRHPAAAFRRTYREQAEALHQMYHEEAEAAATEAEVAELAADLWGG